jgi:hypothetical protein
MFAYCFRYTLSAAVTFMAYKRIKARKVRLQREWISNFCIIVSLHIETYVSAALQDAQSIPLRQSFFFFVSILSVLIVSISWLISGDTAILLV